MLRQQVSANRDGHEMCSVVDNIMHMFELQPGDIEDIVKLTPSDALGARGSREAATSVLTSQVYKDGELREKIVRNTVENGVGHVEVTDNVRDMYGNLLSTQTSGRNYNTPVMHALGSGQQGRASAQRLMSRDAPSVAGTRGRSRSRPAQTRSKKHTKSHRKASMRKTKRLL